MIKRYAISILAFSMLSSYAIAQPDTTRQETKLYKDIEEAARRGKVSNFIYKLFFRPVRISKSQQTKRAKKTDLQRPYELAEGKIIRDIQILTLDPFGRNIRDTSQRSDGFWDAIGNGTHVKTQRMAIRNLLLFKKNEPFDSLLVLESERLIRKQEYVHEVLFYIRPATDGSDSVDIFIRELDNWSLVPRISASTSGFKVDITEKNFMGLGHRFRNIFTRDFSEGNDFTTSYTVPNIRNTYVSTGLMYSRDRFGNTVRGVSAERPFFSPFAKWAGGASMATQYKNDSLRIGELAYNPVQYRFRVFDAWGGYAHRIFHGSSQNDRITRLMYAARYIQMRYLDRPMVPDSLGLYANENLYLISVGLTSPKYVPEKYVFKYGVTEDIPIGKIFSITGGYQERRSGDRSYLGARFGYGNFTNLGYLSAQLEVGSFYRSGCSEQGVLSASLVYFTDLADVGEWKIRQFVKPHLTLGLNRMPQEELEFQRSNGMGGFDAPSLAGEKRFVLTFQTQSYAPWKLLGFRFGPYFIYSAGLLSSPGYNFGHSRVYHQISLGVLLRNDYLVFNNIQFSISFYPLVPGVGDNIVKINARTTMDFMLRDFNMEKPAVLPYE